MARYIDADKIDYKIIMAGMDENAGFRAVALESDINDMPAADVVPKSEVDEIIGKFECFLCHATGGRLSKYTYDLRTMEAVATDCINETYNDGYAEGGKDVAEGIFEEADKIFMATCLSLETYKAWCELKKKYTGE